jgi:hypothetical protein
MKEGLTLLSFDKEVMDSCGKFTVNFKDGTSTIYIAKSIGESTDISGFMVVSTVDGTDIQSLVNKECIKEICLEEATEEEVSDNFS